MKIEEIKLKEFTVIGKEGSTYQDEGIVQKLWQQMNNDFNQIYPLAIKDENGKIDHCWGLMSDVEHKLLPWADNFSKGLYLAGIEVEKDCLVPEGWSKWTVPERTYMVMEIPEGEYQSTFKNGMYFQLYYRRYKLVGAVFDYTDLKTGINYLYFPVEHYSPVVNQQDETDMISCCGIHCKYCFFDGGCNGCMNQPNQNSYGYYCDGQLCTNIKCAKQKGIEGCYKCDEVATCTVGFFKNSPYGRVMAQFIGKEGKQAFEKAVKEMIRRGYNYSKDVEEMSDEERMDFLYQMIK